MAVFNSLGSNYSVNFLQQSLFSKGSYSDSLALQDKLKQRYGGTPYLFYKNRQALVCALRSLPTDKKKVIINGFTCYVVYKAVIDAGYTPVLLDISHDTLHFSVDSLSACIHSTSDIAAVIVQNTLGIPFPIQDILNICRSKKIFVIEDLAHSIESYYSDNLEAGTVGDYTILSFSQDKVVDGISGGALIVRTQHTAKSLNIHPAESHVSHLQQMRDRMYPLATYFIRRAYISPMAGKILHRVLKLSKILPSAVGSPNNSIEPQELPRWYHPLIMQQLSTVHQTTQHRREIASHYRKALPDSIQSDGFANSIQHGSCIRFPIFVSNRKQLITRLQSEGIYVGDIWYDAPISPRSYQKNTQYAGECPIAEEISHSILNLPTHIHVSPDTASRITDSINQFVR